MNKKQNTKRAQFYKLGQEYLVFAKRVADPAMTNAEPASWCQLCDRHDCSFAGHDHLVVCDHFSKTGTKGKNK